MTYKCYYNVATDCPGVWYKVRKGNNSRGPNNKQKAIIIVIVECS